MIWIIIATCAITALLVSWIVALSVLWLISRSMKQQGMIDCPECGATIFIGFKPPKQKRKQRKLGFSTE